MLQYKNKIALHDHDHWDPKLHTIRFQVGAVFKIQKSIHIALMPARLAGSKIWQPLKLTLDLSSRFSRRVAALGGNSTRKSGGNDKSILVAKLLTCQTSWQESFNKIFWIKRDEASERAACFQRERSAFTLIEVMLACVLASILSVVMIQILRTLLLESRQIAESRQIQSETWLLREQLGNDISNARGFRIANDTMMLGGFLSRDPATGMLTQQLAIVTYRIVRKGNSNALERSETLLSSSSAPTWKETVWNGVGSIAATSKGEFLGSQSNLLPELSQLGLQSMEAGISFQLLDPQGNVLVEIL